MERCYTAILLATFMWIVSATIEDHGVILDSSTCGDQPYHQSQLAFAVSLLHSFSYPESRSVFMNLTQTAPNCARAFWGVAASFLHPLWDSPTKTELQTGLEYLHKGKQIILASPNLYTNEDLGLIVAFENYFSDYENASSSTRILRLENSLRELYSVVRTPEVCSFYSLSILAKGIFILDENDHLTSKDSVYYNLKAGKLLDLLLLDYPRYPAALHYCIHSYDFQHLAPSGLECAAQYRETSLEIPHAQHMPAHIYCKLGLWYEAIVSDVVAAQVSTKKIPYGDQLSVLHDEYVHSVEYIIYALLQLGNDQAAEMVLGSFYSANSVALTDQGRGVCYNVYSSTIRVAVESLRWSLLESAPFPSLGLQCGHTGDSLRLYSLLLSKFYSWLHCKVTQFGNINEEVSYLTRLFSNVHDPLSSRCSSQTLNQLERDFLSRYTEFQQSVIAHKPEGKLWWINSNIQLDISRSCYEWMMGNYNLSISLLLQAAELEDLYETPSITPARIMPAREQLVIRYLLVASGSWPDNLSLLPHSQNRLLFAKLAFDHSVEVLKFFPNKFNPMLNQARAATLVSRLSKDDKERTEYITQAHRLYTSILDTLKNATCSSSTYIPASSLDHIYSIECLLNPQGVFNHCGTTRDVQSEYDQFLFWWHDFHTRGISKYKFVFGLWTGVFSILAAAAIGFGSSSTFHFVKAKHL